MRVTVGASGHFHRAPSRSSSNSIQKQVTGKIGSRQQRRGRKRTDTLSSCLSVERNLNASKIMSSKFNSTKENIKQYNSIHSFPASQIQKSHPNGETTTRSIIPATTNTSNTKPKKRRDFGNLLTRDKVWKGEVPNVILKELESGERLRLRDLVQGKVAVIDFWLSRTGSNPFTSMDA